MYIYDEIDQRIIDEHPQSPYVQRARQATTTGATPSIPTF